MGCWAVAATEAWAQQFYRHSVQKPLVTGFQVRVLPAPAELRHNNEFGCVLKCVPCAGARPVGHRLSQSSLVSAIKG